MTGILRSWHCQNSACATTFDAWEANPHCPACGCVRVGWIPGGGHIGKSAGGADKELRILADMFKLGDMNSAQAGRGAKQVSAAPAAPSPRPQNLHTFGGMFTAAVDPSQGAQCVPVVNKIDAKVKAAPGTSLPPSPTWGKPTPMVEARTDARPK